MNKDIVIPVIAFVSGSVVGMILYKMNQKNESQIGPMDSPPPENSLVPPSDDEVIEEPPVAQFSRGRRPIASGPIRRAPVTALYSRAPSSPKPPAAVCRQLQQGCARGDYQACSEYSKECGSF